MADAYFENFKPEIIRIWNGDMTILGAAIGSKQHCENWISQKLDTVIMFRTDFRLEMPPRNVVVRSDVER